jgi:hypothetical protein
MINDLLDVSRIEARHLALERTPTDLAAWLDESLDRLSRLAPANPLRIRTLVRPAPVFVDPARIGVLLRYCTSLRAAAASATRESMSGRITVFRDGSLPNSCLSIIVASSDSSPGLHLCAFS